jgi:hypothetical protein
VRRQVLLATLAIAVVGLTATRAAAQGGSGDAPVFIRGLGGVTFGSVTGGVFGAGGGVRVTPNVIVFGEVGRVTDMLTKDLQDQIDEFIDLAGLEDFTDDFTFTIKLPTTYGFGGARVELPIEGGLTPFVEGGVGFGRISLSAELIVEGIDLSDALRDALDEEEVLTASTELFLVFGGGVTVGVGENGAVDVGFRLNRISSEGESLNVPALYAGFVWRR